MIHSHVAARLYGETKERLRARMCLECRHEQPPPDEEKDDASTCAKCGAELPPTAPVAQEHRAEDDPARE